METIKILVVDDDPGWSEILKDILVHEGYAVQVAMSFEEASTGLIVSGIRLVLMDLQLIDADTTNRQGLKLLSYIGMYNPCARAIVLTAHLENQRAAYQTYHGVFAYHWKQDFNKTTFLNDVHNAIQEALECENGRKERVLYPEFD